MLVIDAPAEGDDSPRTSQGSCFKRSPPSGQEEEHLFAQLARIGKCSILVVGATALDNKVLRLVGGRTVLC